MNTFTRLADNSKKDKTGMAKYRLAIVGDCATQHLATAITGYAYMLNLAIDIYDADYDQIYPQVINKDSEMYAFQPDAILLYMCTEKLYTLWCETIQDDRIVFAETINSQILDYRKHISKNSKASIIQFTFVLNDDFVFGNYACNHKESFIYQLRKLNMLLMEEASAGKNVFFVDLCTIQTQIGRNNMFDPKLYYIAKMPISLKALPLVAANIVSVIQALRGAIIKCVILDLDNTLWGGVIGDDGISGIEIGGLGNGYAFSDFQKWLKELKKRGILLAVCSKNEEPTAKEPFEKHDEMVLRLDDFSVFIANWEDKAANIHTIQQTLNIGMESIVFIDDNPFERDLVRSLIPEITVPDLPEDPAGYISYIQSLNLFETASFSDEDAGRTEQYRAEIQRVAMQQQYKSYDEYLQNLEMSTTVKQFDELHIPRIAQLTQRSNQFNLRTVRYTESEIESIANDDNHITLYFKLKDKLADYGLISIIILEKQPDKTLFINTWLMSCRVLKRGMEEFIINKIIETAGQHKYETIIGEYIETKKNAMVKDIYTRMGFSQTGENVYTANTSSFKPNKTFIAEQKEGQ